MTGSYQEPQGWKRTRKSQISLPVMPGWLPSAHISVKLLSCRLYSAYHLSTDLSEGVDHSDVLSISHGFRKKRSAYKVVDQKSLIKQTE